MSLSATCTLSQGSGSGAGQRGTSGGSGYSTMSSTCQWEMDWPGWLRMTFVAQNRAAGPRTARTSDRIGSRMNSSTKARFFSSGSRMMKDGSVLAISSVMARSLAHSSAPSTPGTITLPSR